MDFLFGDLDTLLKTVGLLGIFGIVFAESGLFIGFFLPGDSLLFTAGFLASQGYFNIILLCALSFAGAVLGDNFGYQFGKRVGPAIFRRENSILFHKKHLDRATRFYAAHGNKTIFFARFFPIVRTFAPILAGVGAMRYRTFFYWNALGGVAWGIGFPLLGYFLGRFIPNIDRYMIPIILLVITASFIPPAIHIIRSPEHRAVIKKYFMRERV